MVDQLAALDGKPSPAKSMMGKYNRNKVKLDGIVLPVPCFESIAGPLEQVALHDDPVGRVHVEFKLGIIIGKVLGEKHKE